MRGLLLSCFDFFHLLRKYLPCLADDTISQSLSGPILNQIKSDFILTTGLQSCHNQLEPLFISKPISNLCYNYNFSFNPSPIHDIKSKMGSPLNPIAKSNNPNTTSHLRGVDLYMYIYIYVQNFCHLLIEFRFFCIVKMCSTAKVQLQCLHTYLILPGP